jgi:hypothetical protein
LQLATVWPDEGHVIWRLSLTNRTSKRLRLGFVTSQYADVTIRGPGYSYRWSEGKGFLQALWSMTLLPHKTYVRCLGADEIDMGESAPGRYELRAWIRAVSPAAGVERRRTWWVLDG